MKPIQWVCLNMHKWEQSHSSRKTTSATCMIPCTLQARLPCCYMQVPFSNGDLVAQSLPELASLLQLCQLHILNPMIYNHKLLPCFMQLRYTQSRGIGQFMCIRIPSLEETGKGPCIAFIDKTISLLRGIYAVPLISKSATMSLAG